MKRITVAELKPEQVNNLKVNSTKTSSSSNNTESSSSYTPEIFRHSLLLMLMCCSIVAGNFSKKNPYIYFEFKFPRIDHTLMASIRQRSGN